MKLPTGSSNDLKINQRKWKQAHLLLKPQLINQQKPF